ncbi:hypothetical protein C9994_03260 [Marivirga lumbricoides]|uniref:histidine kinase n=1 Tax=Marivirga lumbricoides TaxID=1046115 RepID=A0A2T4DUC2_9BACT|nr:hypothetical protein C9994_03260 [Marivirga lumbricoides]
MKLILITLFCFFSLIGFSQPTLDSLKNQLKKKTLPDSVKIKLNLDISFYYRNFNLDSMRFYANKARLLGKEIFDKNGELQGTRNIALSYVNEGKYDTSIYILNTVIKEAKSEGESALSNLADAYNSLGKAYFSLALYDSAVLAFQQTSEIFKKLNRPVDVAGSLINLGSILEDKGETVRALDYFKEALLVFEAQKHGYGIATASFNLANIFTDQGDYDKAMLYYKKVAEYDSTAGHSRDFGGSLSSIANLLLNEGDTLNALKTFKRAIHILDSVNASCEMILPINNLGDLYLSLNRMDSSLILLNKALAIAMECEMPKQIVAIRFDLGKYFLKTNELAKAEENLLEAYKTSTDLTLKNEIANSADKLYILYKRKGQTEKALEYIEIARTLDNELFNQENTRKIAQLEAEYQLEKERETFRYEQEKRNLAYQESLSSERKIIYQFIGGTVLLTILLLLILRFYFQKKKINNKLQKTLKAVNEHNNQIQEQNEEISWQAELLSQKSKELEKQSMELTVSNNALAQLNEEKNTIIGIVAHDLKTPLNQIKGLLSLIKMEINNKEAIPDYLDKMEQSANRSINMIDRILDINALEHNTVNIKTEQIELSTLIQEVLDDYTVSTHNKEIELLFEHKEKFEIFSDSLLLREIIDNIISNSIKFSPKQSRITVELKDLPNSYCIAVTDQGPGISKEDQLKMFNKYQQVSANPTGNEKSTGLGLAIVKRYANILNYQIKCISDGKNGTCFIIEIPK